MTTQTMNLPMQKRAPRHRHVLVIGAAFVVVALVVTGLVAGWRTYRYPGVFYGVPETVGTWGTWPVNTPDSFGMSDAYNGVDPEEVTIVSATPNVLVNTANATIGRPGLHDRPYCRCRWYRICAQSSQVVQSSGAV
jgi:hypothetical protein